MGMVPTVFVVDDDAAVRDSLIFMIQTVGLTVEGYPSAEAFLEAYHPDRPGCLVLKNLAALQNGAVKEAAQPANDKAVEKTANKKAKK